MNLPHGNTNIEEHAPILEEPELDSSAEGEAQTALHEVPVEEHKDASDEQVSEPSVAESHVLEDEKPEADQENGNCLQRSHALNKNLSKPCAWSNSLQPWEDTRCRSRAKPEKPPPPLPFKDLTILHSGRVRETKTKLISRTSLFKSTNRPAVTLSGKNSKGASAFKNPGHVPPEQIRKCPSCTSLDGICLDEEHIYLKAFLCNGNRLYSRSSGTSSVAAYNERFSGRLTVKQNFVRKSCTLPANLSRTHNLSKHVVVAQDGTVVGDAVVTRPAADTSPIKPCLSSLRTKKLRNAPQRPTSLPQHLRASSTSALHRPSSLPPCIEEQSPSANPVATPPVPTRRSKRRSNKGTGHNISGRHGGQNHDFWLSLVLIESSQFHAIY